MNEEQRQQILDAWIEEHASWNGVNFEALSLEQANDGRWWVKDNTGSSLRKNIAFILKGDLPRLKSKAIAGHWEKILEEIAGDPDYATVANVWCWPDGGWMAGVILTDRDWAREQSLLAAKLPIEAKMTVDQAWNATDGFRHGVNASGPTPEVAVKTLYVMLRELERPE